MGRKCAYVLPIPTQPFNEMSQSSKFKKVQYFEELLSILTGNSKLEFFKFYFNMKQNSQLLIELNSEINMDSRLDSIILNVKDCLEVCPRIDKINYLSLIANEFSKNYINLKGLKCSNDLFFKAKKFSKELRLNLKNKYELKKLKKDKLAKKSKVGDGPRGKSSSKGDIVVNNDLEFSEAAANADIDVDIDQVIGNINTINSANLPNNAPINFPSTSEYSKELNFGTMGSLEKIWIGDDSINNDIRLHTIETYDDFEDATLIEFDDNDLSSIPISFNNSSSSIYLNTSLSTNIGHSNTLENTEPQLIQNELNTTTCNDIQNPANSVFSINPQSRDEGSNPHS